MVTNGRLADAIAERHTAEALKLRAVHHKYAKQIAAHARTVERHASMLLRFHAKIRRESIAIAGANYEEHHQVGFVEHESIAKQQEEEGAEVEGAGLDDVIQLAGAMANRAGKVAACGTPPRLLSESD